MNLPSLVRPSLFSLGAILPLAKRITHSRLIVGFRNRLVHEYPQIDAEAVYAIAQHDTPILRKECALLLQEVDGLAP